MGAVLADTPQFPWKKHFHDSSQCCDRVDSEPAPRRPGFLKCNVTKEPSWLEGWQKPPLIVRELRRKGLETVKNVGKKELASKEGAYDIVSLLKDCARKKDLSKGSKLHAYIQEHKFLEENCYVASTLVSMYARCGALEKAQQVLDKLPIRVRDVVTWNALIAGYAQQGQGEEALKCFESMLREGHSPDVVTFISVLKACGSIGSIAKGEQIHNKIFNLGMLDRDIALCSALVGMYAKCGAHAKALEVFNELPVRDVVMWNELIAGYVQHGQGFKALECFDNMKCEGNSPSLVSFICALKACGSIGAVAKGEHIHDNIVSLDMLEKDAVLGSTLVDMYARCGALSKAKQVLDELPVRNVVAWTALMAGYDQQGQSEEALRCFNSMQGEGHSPDVVSFTSVLKACGSIGAVAKGEEIHDKVVSLGVLEKDIVLGSTLVDMYAKCGALLKAHEVFNELPNQNVGTWNALIAGYAQQGKGEEALDQFESMQVRPNPATLVCVLNACCHSGLLDQADLYFLSISIKYGIIPNEEHCCCMVDLFGRAGKLDKALVAIKEIPSADYLPSWLALLAACHKWGDVKIGRLAFEQALYLDKNNGAVHVCMANIFTAAGMDGRCRQDCSESEK